MVSLRKTKTMRLHYVDGIVEYMPKLDVDYVNIFYIQALFKNLGYDSKKRCLWLKPTSTDLATRLRELDGDVNEMCKAALAAKGENVIHLYFEHHVNVLEILEDLGNMVNNSSKGEDDKDAVKDYNIKLGKQFKWLKNDKIRAWAKCASEGYDSIIYCVGIPKPRVFKLRL